MLKVVLSFWSSVKRSLFCFGCILVIQWLLPIPSCPFCDVFAICFPRNKFVDINAFFFLHFFYCKLLVGKTTLLVPCLAPMWSQLGFFWVFFVLIFTLTSIHCWMKSKLLFSFATWTLLNFILGDGRMISDNSFTDWED